jgi:HK97 family phage major capsid protein
MLLLWQPLNGFWPKQNHHSFDKEPFMAELAEKIGELGASLASIKEQVGNLATDFTSKLAANGEVSAELKEKTDKALSELGDVTTRLSDMEKRAARERENGEEEQKSLGDMVVEAAKAKDFSGAIRGAVRVQAERAALTTADGTVGAGRSAGTSLIPGQRVPGIIAPPNRRMTIRDLLMPGQTSSNNIEYVKETGYTNNAAPVAETTAKPYSELTFNMANAPVRTIAHLFKASRQILDDAVGLKSYIDGRARYGLQFKEEAQLLKGDGTGQNILGVQPQATAFAPAFVPQDATPIDRLRLAILQVVLAEYPATGFVLNPVDWAAIELTKDNEGRYIIANPQGGIQPTLWNLPVVETQSQTLGTFLTGAFSMAAQIFDRMEIEVLLSTENVDDFEKNMVSIRAEERLGLAVYRPEAFVTGAVSA